jgi:hypothetical protein
MWGRELLVYINTTYELGTGTIFETKLILFFFFYELYVKHYRAKCWILYHNNGKASTSDKA